MKVGEGGGSEFGSWKFGNGERARCSPCVVVLQTYDRCAMYICTFIHFNAAIIAQKQALRYSLAPPSSIGVRPKSRCLRDLQSAN